MLNLAKYKYIFGFAQFLLLFWAVNTLFKEDMALDGKMKDKTLNKNGGVKVN